MKIDYTTYFNDGTSGVTTIEKPAGAHPDSVGAVWVAILEAERSGKRVARIGRSVAAYGRIVDISVATREHWENAWKMAEWPPIPFNATDVVA